MLRILKFIRSHLLIILIILFAFLVRFAGLALTPPSLNWDEISHGYNAYSILKTGKDEWGFTLPTIFRAFGDYKLPVYIYLTTISEFFFGLNEVAVRLPSVIAGTLTVLFTYFLVKRLSKYNQLAIFSAFFMAIEPWDLFLSRVAVEANVALFLIIAGIYFFMTGFEKKRNLILSSILLGLSVWTYNSARVFVPLLLVSLFVIYKSEIIKILSKNKKTFYLFTLIILIFFVPMFIQLAKPIGSARYDEVRILDSGAINSINELRNNSKLGITLSKIVYNKATYFGVSFVRNYFSYFNPRFLFLNGGSQYQFSIPKMGILYLSDLPLFIMGLFYLIKNVKKEKLNQIVIFWLLLAPIAGSLTRESPHVLRDIVSVLPFAVIIAIGFMALFSLIKRNRLVTALLIIYIFILGIGVETYAKTAVTSYRTNYSWSWQFGYKEVAGYINDNYGKYDKFVITKKYGEPHEFLLFYLKYDPEKYRNDPNLNRFYQSNWYWVDSFDKFYFVNDWQIPKSGSVFVEESKRTIDCKNSRCLLITSPGNSPSGWRKMNTINFLDGSPAFEMYEN